MSPSIEACSYLVLFTLLPSVKNELVVSCSSCDTELSRGEVPLREQRDWIWNGFDRFRGQQSLHRHRQTTEEGNLTVLLLLCLWNPTSLSCEVSDMATYSRQADLHSRLASQGLHQQQCYRTCL